MDHPKDQSLFGLGLPGFNNKLIKQSDFERDINFGWSIQIGRIFFIGDRSKKMEAMTFFGATKTKNGFHCGGMCTSISGTYGPLLILYK